MGISHVAPRPAAESAGYQPGFHIPARARQSAMPETDGRAGVRGKAGFTHDMTFFRRDVRRKRFSTHGELYSMEITIRKNHVAEKSRAGWSLWRHGRPCPCEWVSGDSLTG